MISCLLFQLYGPMASWGEVAVGEVRSTADHPTKSAVLGMVAAAMGITREQDGEHRKLAGGYGYGLRLDTPGGLLRDFHTAQAPKGKGGRGLTTRRDELEYKSVSTILSTRDYRVDALATVCLWATSDAPPWPLDELKSALERPRFSLFLGRKSCPLALPMNPKVVDANSLKRAFAQYPISTDLLRKLGHDRREKVRVYWQSDVEGLASGFDASQIRERWDQPKSRERWQFGRRDEAFAAVDRSVFEEVS